MGKNKLARWAELNSLSNVIQPVTGDVIGKDHPVKGNWRSTVFRNNNPVVLELACGRGEYTTGLSEIFPEKNFIGIDIKGARLWRGAKTASETGLLNAAFLRTRIEFISSFFAEDEADEIWIIFPDPHPGKRNSNKRLTCPWFLNKYNTILKNGGLVHLKTDNRELFDYTHRLAAGNSLVIVSETGDLYSPDYRAKEAFAKIYEDQAKSSGIDVVAGHLAGIRTHYEEKFLKEGMKICHLAFRLEKGRIIKDV